MQSAQRPPLEEFLDLARAGDLAAARAFCEALLGFDLSQKNFKGHSALMLAAYHGHFDFCLWLLENGADVHSIDDAGSSVLMGVAFKGYDDVAELLLKFGADAHHKNHAGQDALQMAQMFGRVAVAARLAAHLKTKSSSRFGTLLSGWARFAVQSLRNLSHKSRRAHV